MSFFQSHEGGAWLGGLGRCAQTQKAVVSNLLAGRAISSLGPLTAIVVGTG